MVVWRESQVDTHFMKRGISLQTSIFEGKDKGGLFFRTDDASYDIDRKAVGVDRPLESLDLGRC
jgi:hypothetical protein